MSEIANWRPSEMRTNNHEMNRLYNCHNEFQGKYKRVVCCCTAGLLRSPTTAVVLSQAPYNYNTRACGLEESFALVPFDKVLATWADEIVVMTRQHRNVAKDYLDDWGIEKEIVVLGISDDFEYRNPELITLIKERYNSHLKSKNV